MPKQGVPKYIARELKNSLVSLIFDKIMEPKFYTPDGSEVDPSFIKQTDEGYEFDRDAFEAVGKEMPSGQPLVERPNEKYLTRRCDGPFRDTLMDLVRPFIGPSTIYNKDDAGISEFLTKAMQKFRPQNVHGPNMGMPRALTGFERLAIINEDHPTRGVNSVMICDDRTIDSLVGLLGEGEVPATLRPKRYEAKQLLKKMLQQAGIFDAEDAEMIVETAPGDFIKYCMRQVDNGNKHLSKRELQDAQNVRGATAFNLAVVVHSSIIALMEGKCVWVEYIKGTCGILVLLPTGKFHNPCCIGDLKKKKNQGTFNKKMYKKHGANRMIDFGERRYLYDIMNCKPFPVFPSEENDATLLSTRLTSSVIRLRTDYYIAMYGENEPKVGDDGLSTYNYKICEYLISVHQLTELGKRQIGADSRSNVAKAIAKTIGSEGRTPDEIFPVVGSSWARACKTFLRRRINWLNPKNMNEISDVEHCLSRDRLVDNSAFYTRALNHSLNRRIVTTQKNTGDYNFCHVQLTWQKNSMDVQLSEEYLQKKKKYEEAHRKKNSDVVDDDSYSDDDSESEHSEDDSEYSADN